MIVALWVWCCWGTVASFKISAILIKSYRKFKYLQKLSSKLLKNHFCSTDVKEVRKQTHKKANKQKLPFFGKWLDTMSVISPSHA